VSQATNQVDSSVMAAYLEAAKEFMDTWAPKASSLSKLERIALNFDYL